MLRIRTAYLAAAALLLAATTALSAPVIPGLEGRWVAWIPKPPHQLGPYLEFRIVRGEDDHFLYVIEGRKERLNVRNGRVIVRDSRTETGSYLLEVTETGFSYLTADGTVEQVRFERREKRGLVLVIDRETGPLELYREHRAP